MKTMTTIALLIWVTVVFGWDIWINKWRGLLQCAVIIIAAILMVLGEHFQFNGNLAALAFVAIVVVAHFTVGHGRRRSDKE